MKKAFTITDKKIIKNILDEAEFGTLALCSDNRPYSLPLNFVELKDEIYFHGAQKGKKLDLIKQNSYASFSVVEPYSILPSYFSTDDGSACPATHMFKSVIIDGEIKLVEEYEEKAEALNELMKKLQSEGKYIPLHDKMYEKIINATALFKLVSISTTCKVKFGQNFSKERYEKVLKYLKQRGTSKDITTLNMINEFYNV
ncbi:MAG TPA: pyridoxamine 5'-phosphate oxidase family protein [Sulfurospirillum arcachonense]|nr:pyridoxamine 5'-phosphate oxidase family protein [Sulfurospirillum arcachonense]HIP45499.1 pyridoxamine 5'-phosphate oxidase family protein [Sulfurospirillum arcachonense]